MPKNMKCKNNLYFLANPTPTPFNGSPDSLSDHGSYSIDAVPF